MSELSWIIDGEGKCTLCGETAEDQGLHIHLLHKQNADLRARLALAECHSVYASKGKKVGVMIRVDEAFRSALKERDDWRRYHDSIAEECKRWRKDAQELFGELAICRASLKAAGKGE